MFKKLWGQPTTTIGLISHQKYQLCTCSTLLSTFAVVLHDHNDKNSTNFPVTRFTKEMYVFLFTTFSLQLIFTLVRPLAFLIFSPPLSNFHVFRPKKLASVVFYLSLSYRQNVRGAWNATFHPRLHEEEDVRTYGRFCKNRNFLDT